MLLCVPKGKVLTFDSPRSLALAVPRIPIPAVTAQSSGIAAHPPDLPSADELGTVLCFRASLTSSSPGIHPRQEGIRCFAIHARKLHHHSSRPNGAALRLSIDRSIRGNSRNNPGVLRHTATLTLVCAILSFGRVLNLDNVLDEPHCQRTSTLHAAAHRRSLSSPILRPQSLTRL